jgi:hypothetical protein
MFSCGKGVSSHPVLRLSIADSLQKRQMSTKTNNHSSYLFLTRKPFYIVSFSGIMEEARQDMADTLKAEARIFGHAKVRESSDYSGLLTNTIPQPCPFWRDSATPISLPFLHTPNKSC